MSQLDGWAKYFEHLATEETLPHFNTNYYKDMQLKHLLVTLQAERQCKMQDHVQISEEMMTNHVKALKTGKAVDVFGLIAEHTKFASPKLIPILTPLTNNIFYKEKRPSQSKIGDIAPTHKKNKLQKNTDNYRQSTVASVGKLVEKEIMKRTKPKSEPTQDPSQYGFTEECSPALCALMVTEAIAESKGLEQPLYVTYW